MDRKSLLFAGAVFFGLSCNGGAGGCGGPGGAAGCSGSDQAACDACAAPQLPYRCAVPSTNNIICALDDAQAAGLCPEGATRIPCEGGSGGQNGGQDGGSGGQGNAPGSKQPDAKIDSKAK